MREHWVFVAGADVCALRVDAQVAEKETLLSKFIDQFKQPLIMLLLASAAVSALLGSYDDAISITLVCLIDGPEPASRPGPLTVLTFAVGMHTTAAGDCHCRHGRVRARMAVRRVAGGPEQDRAVLQHRDPRRRAADRVGIRARAGRHCAPAVGRPRPRRRAPLGGTGPCCAKRAGAPRRAKRTPGLAATCIYRRSAWKSTSRRSRARRIPAKR